MYARFKEMADVKVGDVVNACSGLNVRIEEIYPYYYTIGAGRAEVLIDVDLVTSNEGCSFFHCGVGPPITPQQAEDCRLETIDHWTKAKARGEGDWDFPVRYTNTIIHRKDGTYTSNYGYVRDGDDEHRIVILNPELEGGFCPPHCTYCGSSPTRNEGGGNCGAPECQGKHPPGWVCSLSPADMKVSPKWETDEVSVRYLGFGA